MAALRNTESGAAAGNVSTSVTPTGWIHVSIEPTDNIETSLECELKQSADMSHTGISRPISSNGSTFSSDLSKSNSPPVAFSSSSGSTEDRLLESLARKNVGSNFIPSSSPSSLSLGSAKTFYTHVWKSMIFLASDPNPSVAHMAQHVVHSVHDKVSIMYL